MGLFTKEKKKEEKESAIPDPAEFPMKAYVYRLQPERFGKLQLAGRISGDYDGFFTPQELEDLVTKLNGGGTYRCKVVKSGETKTHLGYHNFTAPGNPLIDGDEIDQEKEHKKREELNKVNKIEEEIETEEAAARLDEVKARRRAKQKQLGLIDDPTDDDDDSSSAQFNVPGYESPEMAGLKAQLKALEHKLEEKDRQSLLEKHQMEMKSLRDEMTHRIEQLTNQQKNNGNNDNVGSMMGAQMEAIKSIISAGQANTQAMLSSNAEMMKLIMSRDPSAGINDRVDKLVEKLLDSKSSTGKEVMEAMKESFNTGIMMAKGGEQTPTSMADVAREFSTGVLGIVGEFMKQKGSMSKEVLAQEIQKAAGKAINDIKRRMVPQMGHHRPHHQLGDGGVPAGQAMPATQQNEQGAQHPPADAGKSLSVAELRARVDKVMEAFIEDMNNGTENWKGVAMQQIPQSELQRIGEFNFENVAQYTIVHGSPEVVERVLSKLKDMGLIDDDQASAIVAGAQSPQQQAPQPQPAGTVSEQSDEVIPDDSEEDDSLMGDQNPVQQGEQQEAPQAPPEEPVTVASQPTEVSDAAEAKPKKRSRRSKK